MLGLERIDPSRRVPRRRLRRSALGAALRGELGDAGADRAELLLLVGRLVAYLRGVPAGRYVDKVRRS